jgi:hypothetical protein
VPKGIIEKIKVKAELNALEDKSELTKLRKDLKQM